MTAASLALAVIIATLIWWLAGLALALLYPSLRSRLMALNPRTRCRVLTALASLPAAFAVVSTLLLYLPATRGLGVASHCHEGLGCGTHAPAISGGVLDVLLPLLALAILVIAIRRVAPPLRRQAHRTRQLLAMAQPENVEGYAVIDAEDAFALTVGLLRPRIILSSGLLHQLDPRQRRSVLLHERAHAARRDSLRQWLTALGAPRPLSGPGRPLQRDLHTACEQACDQQAALDVGDPLEVAESLLRAQRSARTPQSASLDGESALSARVAALIAPPRPERLPAPVLVVGVAAAALVAALVGLDMLHHGAEQLQTWVGAQP